MIHLAMLSVRQAAQRQTAVQQKNWKKLKRRLVISLKFSWGGGGKTWKSNKLIRPYCGLLRKVV